MLAEIKVVLSAIIYFSYLYTYMVKFNTVADRDNDHVFEI